MCVRESSSDFYFPVFVFTFNRECELRTVVHFLNGPSPASFCLFSSAVQTNITILSTNQFEKCPSSIRCWDLNP